MSFIRNIISHPVNSLYAFNTAREAVKEIKSKPPPKFKKIWEAKKETMKKINEEISKTEGRRYTFLYHGTSDGKEMIQQAESNEFSELETRDPEHGTAEARLYVTANPDFCAEVTNDNYVVKVRTDGDVKVDEDYSGQLYIPVGNHVYVEEIYEVENKEERKNFKRPPLNERISVFFQTYHKAFEEINKLPDIPEE